MRNQLGSLLTALAGGRRQQRVRAEQTGEPGLRQAARGRGSSSIDAAAALDRIVSDSGVRYEPAAVAALASVLRRPMRVPTADVPRTKTPSRRLVTR